MAKPAVIALGRSWAQELAPHQVRVNTISPGPIETPIFGQPAEVASLVSYLASDAASFVTGDRCPVQSGRRHGSLKFPA